MNNKKNINKKIYSSHDNSYNISDSDEQNIRISTNEFQPKFIKQLNFIANTHLIKQKRKKQRRNVLENKSFIMNKINKQMINQTIPIPKIKTQKKMFQFFQYNGHQLSCKFDRSYFIHGDTTINYQCGVQFRGSFRNGLMTNGHFDFKNGYQYWGQLNGKRFVGKGTLRCPDGKIITGIWNGWNIVGRVQLEYPSGDAYYGEVKDFKKHGDGYLFFKSGNKYIGQFYQGNIHGQGSYFQKQTLIQSGIWQNGRLIQKKIIQDVQKKKHESRESQRESILNMTFDTTQNNMLVLLAQQQNNSSQQNGFKKRSSPMMGNINKRRHSQLEEKTKLDDENSEHKSL